MAEWKCNNCKTTILQNYVEKCSACGSKNVIHVSGHIKDNKEITHENRN